MKPLLIGLLDKTKKKRTLQNTRTLQKNKNKTKNKNKPTTKAVKH